MSVMKSNTVAVALRDIIRHLNDHFDQQSGRS
jgi:hypothetical protein